jgi:hypothetical protein
MGEIEMLYPLSLIHVMIGLGVYILYLLRSSAISSGRSIREGGGEGGRMRE